MAYLGKVIALSVTMEESIDADLDVIAFYSSNSMSGEIH